MNFKEYFRRQALRKRGSTVPTCIMPAEKISTAIALIDVEEPSYDECKTALMSYFRENKIKGEIFFFDFRRIASDERLITSITNTVLRKDLNWFGMPSDEKLAILDNLKPDLFISLLRSDNFAARFTAKYCKARFKVGREQIDRNVFDLVVSDPSDRKLTQAEAFEAIKGIISKIK